MRLCKWKFHWKSKTAWMSGCGHIFFRLKGNPKKIGRVICPYCGKKIKEPK